VFGIGEIEFWHWWVLALLLIGIEIFAPGFIFIWLAAAAGVVGVLLLVMPGLSWQLQLLAFGVLSVASVFAWWRFGRKVTGPSDRPQLNRRAEAYVGRIFVVAEPIENGYGVVTVDDSRWRVSAESDVPSGARVRVTGVDGTILKVEPA
jgi:membrane protein implicated in regulation of membrane protease activity